MLGYYEALMGIFISLLGQTVSKIAMVTPIASKLVARLYRQQAPITWDTILQKDIVRLYAGNVPLNHPAYKTHVGLSLHKADVHHLKHDITKSLPIPDNCVDEYQSEDVFEHIEYSDLVGVVNEIHRVLKPGGLLRISVPDYQCDILYDRSLKDENGVIVFDKGGGGSYVNGVVVGGGHLWFPTLDQVNSLLESSLFHSKGEIQYLHYYDASGKSVTHTIDYSKGYIQRTPDHDKRVQKPYRALSLVVDLYKR